MDTQFLEFWGNFMLNAARGQKQLEDLEKWMRGGFTGYEELTSLFRKIYGLEGVSKESSDYQKIWTGAQETFKESLKDYLALMGVVPREEYLTLVKKYEELKEKVASHEETIKHLRMLLSEAKNKEYQDLAGHFDELVKKQGDQFQKVMEGLGQVFKKDSSSQDT